MDIKQIAPAAPSEAQVAKIKPPAPKENTEIEPKAAKKPTEEKGARESLAVA